MAKVENNLMLYGVSGMIGGQLVVRQTGQGGVLAVRPRPGHHSSSAAQRAQQERFRLAVLYGKSAKDRPEYQALAEMRGVSSFNVATSDYLHAPIVTDLDLSEYRGQPGEIIRVRAVDDVQVARVRLVLLDPAEQMLEQGEMHPSEQDPQTWVYTTTQRTAGTPVTVVALATDLAGQTGSRSSTLGV